MKIGTGRGAVGGCVIAEPDMRREHFYLVVIPCLWFFRVVVLAADNVAPVLTSRHVDGTNAYFDLAAWPGDYVIEASTNPAGVWTLETNLSVGREGVVSAAVPLAGRESLFLRAVGLTSSDGTGCLAQFQTLGTTFEPEVGCDNAPPQELRWIWSDGTTSFDYPVASKDFGTPDARVQGLLVNPMTSVTSINLGFDGADGGGLTPLSNRPPQNVTAVRFPYPLTSLRYWGSSYNPITNTLDFSGFASLEIIECYACTNLQHILATNLPALRRICVESANLQGLDLSGNPNLEDLRGTANAYTNIVVGRGTGSRIWHWCAGQNPQLTQRFTDIMTNFYSLRELWIWNDNQSGTLTTVSTNLVSVWAEDNHYSAADFTGQSGLYYCDIYNNEVTNLVLVGCTGLQHLDAHNNELPDLVLAGCTRLGHLDVNNNGLTNIVLTGCTGLEYLDLHQNRLSTQMLDDVLAFLDTSAPNLQTADLTQNAQYPSATGYGHYANLTNRGVEVLVEWLNTNNIAGGTNAITFVTASRNPHMEIRTEHGVPESIVWHWGDGAITTNALLADHDFGPAGRYTNYVQVIPPGCVTYFGSGRTNVDQGIEGVFGAANFPNLNYLFLYRESVTSLSLAGCSNLVQLHLAGNPVPTDVCDQWFIDLNNAVAGPVTGADFWYGGIQRSSVSDLAWESLVNKGFVMHY